MKRFIGQRYHVAAFGDYILAQVEAGRVCLIALDGGNRMQDPIDVMDCLDISEHEFFEMWKNDESPVEPKLIEK